LLIRGFEDQLRDLLGMGNQGEVASLHFDGLGSHPFSHETLQVRIDDAVLRRNCIITRLRSPCRLRGLAGEESLMERLLNRVEHLCFRLGQVAREIAEERLLAETSLFLLPQPALRYVANIASTKGAQFSSQAFRSITQRVEIRLWVNRVAPAMLA
jgi:hypothetical protein